jgi:citrate synthase
MGRRGADADGDCVSHPDAPFELTTSIGAATVDSITIMGRDLPTQLMGHLSFTDLAFLLATTREPTAEESTLFNAVLVSLTDHGLTPIAIAARLTYLGAPDALQGTIAAGLLGAGSVFLGPTADTARFLSEIADGQPADADDDALGAAAAAAVDAALERGERIPGIGHPIHKQADPRVRRLYDLATSLNLVGIHLRILQLLPELAGERTGKPALPVNGAGAGGAALADIGIPVELIRGFSLLARTAGLVGHIREELERPLAPALMLAIHEHTRYVPPRDQPNG